MSQSYQHGDYNRGGMIAFAFSMVFTLAFFVYVAFVHIGVDLKELEAAQPKTEKAAEQPDGEPTE
ncbi:MAG: hypothetical protein HRT44_12660 [Bdellovibrionales bacterium]|nr:hypothetical protein [Bdellovibrionales bacterium]NQZ20089.1 hypothetical protein [Bdellovibrionales bacterium]